MATSRIAVVALLCTAWAGAQESRAVSRTGTEMLRRAEILGQRGSVDEAVVALREAAQRLESEGKLERSANAWANLAKILGAQGRRSAALDACRSFALVRVLEREARDDADVAISLNNVGFCLDSFGCSAEALPLFEAALAMRRRLLGSDHPDLAGSIGNLACCLDSLGRTEEALPLFEAALAMSRRCFAGDHADVVRSLNNLGLCLDALGRSAEALPRLDEGLAMAKRLFESDHPDVARGLHGVAVCLMALGRSAEALLHYEAALTMWRGLFERDHPEVAKSLHGVAYCLDCLGRSAEALPQYEAALAMRRRLFEGDHPEVATSLNGVAYCLDSLGRSAEALPPYEAALAMRRRLRAGDHPDVATSLNNVACCLDALGRSAEALPRHEMALAMRKRLFAGDHADVVTSLINLASCLRSLGRAVEVLPQYEAAYAMTRRLFDGDHPLIALSLNNHACCLDALGRSTDALPRFEAALAMNRRLMSPDVAKSCANVAGICFAGLHDVPRARDLYREAVSVLEDRRVDARFLTEQDRGTYFATLDQGGAHLGLCRAELALGNQQAALAALEQGRGRSTLDLLERSRFDPLDEAARRARLRGDDRFAGELETARAELARCEQALRIATHVTTRARARRDLEAAARRALVEDALAQERAASLACRDASRASFLKIHDIVPMAHSIAPERMQTLVRKNERLLLFALAPDGGHVFVAPPSDEAIHALALNSTKDLPAKIASLRAAASRRATTRAPGVEPGSRSSSASDGLFSMLFPTELWREIEKLDTVYVVLDDALQGLPFEALQVDAEHTWLDVGPKIVYVPSASVLAWMQTRRNEQQRVEQKYDALVLGDPLFARGEATSQPATRERSGLFFSSDELAALPGTRREALAIEQTVGKDRCKLLLGEDATKAQLFELAPKARIVHLATHAIIDETDRASFSALALTVPKEPSKDDDGFLRLHEVLDVWRDRLSACELVVLSACATHKGQRQASDAFFGFPIGFMFAGAPAVISSLWRVDDASTAELFSAFYRELKTGKTKLEAFTIARKEIKKRWPDPYHWAAFVYCGDPR